jgi:Notch-like protein
LSANNTCVGPNADAIVQTPTDNLIILNGTLNQVNCAALNLTYCPFCLNATNTVTMTYTGSGITTTQYTQDVSVLSYRSQRVYGSVVDGQNGIPGVIITVTSNATSCPTPLGTTTGNDGSFAFDFILPNTDEVYQLELTYSKTDYLPYVQTLISVDENDIAVGNVPLDVDPCTVNNGGCWYRTPLFSVSCQSNTGIVTCGACPTGMRHANVSNQFSDCVDINECAEGGDVTCSSMNNGEFVYECVNYLATAFSTGVNCKPIEDVPGAEPFNWCTDPLRPDGGCAVSCTPNPEGGRTCGACLSPHYTGSGDQLITPPVGCNDVNECAVNNGGCPTPAVCVNNNGANRTCVCPAGYNTIGDPSQSGGCQDVDECQTANPCLVGLTCVNLPGTYTCGRCSPTYCQNGATCANFGNQAVCTCAPGFTGHYCELSMDECASNPCLHGGTCFQTTDGDTCFCPAGYSGPLCQTDTNECGSTPCRNGGTCSDTTNGYTCACVTGYSGTVCQTNINECASNPCQNGATCVDSLNSYSCVCRAGFSGVTCGIEHNECDSNPCQNGATCSDGINGFSCSCVPGYAGTTCGTEIDECEDHECQHGATCVDGINGYTCTCVAGFSGAMCEDPIDECASNPCQNGGTCMDATNSYTCMCVLGYTGLHCQTNINECASSPCTNGATCVDAVAGYTCTCADGYTGTICNNEVLECDSDPCQNGGECIEGTASYTCICAAGYSGVRCQTEIDGCASAPCQNGGTCSNNLGMYVCACLPGYMFADCSMNIDECASTPCQNGGTCTDGINGYTCTCAELYYGTHCQTAAQCMRYSPNMPIPNVITAGANSRAEDYSYHSSSEDIIVDPVLTSWAFGMWVQIGGLGWEQNTQVQENTVVHSLFRISAPDDEDFANGAEMRFLKTGQSTANLYCWAGFDASWKIRAITIDYSARTWHRFGCAAAEIDSDVMVYLHYDGTTTSAGTNGVTLGSIRTLYTIGNNQEGDNTPFPGQFRFVHATYNYASTAVRDQVLSGQIETLDSSGAPMNIATVDFSVPLLGETPNDYGSLIGDTDSAPLTSGSTSPAGDPVYQTCLADPWVTCPPSRTGTNCQLESPCVSSPCQNGGTCIDTRAATYTCSCWGGYTGTLCQTPP